jgi:hypothetical protein
MYFATDNGTVIACLETPMKFLLTFLPILALSLARLSAIGISFDRVWFESRVLDPYGPSIEIEQDPSFHAIPLSIGDASDSNTLKGLWRFTNTPNEAILDGTWYMQGSLIYNAYFTFTISEPVSYFITGEIRQLVDTSTPLGGTIGTVLTASGPDSFSAINATDVGTFSLPPIVGARTLMPGQYSFRPNGTGSYTESVSNITFRLTPPPPSVPDGGSTLMILGLAICAIGGIFRKVNLA